MEYKRNPFEVIKQQMQIGLNNTILETSKQIVARNGLSGYF